MRTTADCRWAHGSRRLKIRTGSHTTNAVKATPRAARIASVMISLTPSWLTGQQNYCADQRTHNQEEQREADPCKRTHDPQTTPAIELLRYAVAVEHPSLLSTLEFTA